LPLKSALVEQLQAEVERAQEAQAADQRRKTLRDLHEFLEEIRGLYGLDFPPPSRLASMDASLRAFWKERRPIQQWLEFSRSPEAARDLLDLALFAADWKVRMAQPGQRESACKHALTILDDAQELFGPGAVLHHARQRYRKELKLPPLDDSTAPAPKTAWEHTILGRSYLERGDLAMASQCLHQATERWPHGFWPNFYLGLCSHRQGRFAEAVSAFSVCIGSTPATASAFHNRALGYSALGRHDLALRDYAQALELNPKLSAAALNRGLLYLDARKYGEAEHDLERALSLGATPATVHFNLALVQVAQHKPDLARRHLRIVLSLNPEDTQARGLWNRLSAENGK